MTVYAAAFLALCVPPMVLDNRMEVDARASEMRDASVYRTAPDSLHLDASAAGNHYYRFGERAVRGGARVRLTFHYLVAAGTRGEVRARVSQYADTPQAWKVLSGGRHDIPMGVVGRWTRVDHSFTAEPGATTVAVDFLVDSDCGCGECWVDDVCMRELGQPVTQGP